jgi:hypothetical protein
MWYDAGTMQTLVRIIAGVIIGFSEFEEPLSEDIWP